MYEQWQILAFSLALINILLGAILYQLGTILGMDSLKRYAKLFSLEATLSVFLALFITAFIAFGNQIVSLIYSELQDLLDIDNLGNTGVYQEVMTDSYLHALVLALLYKHINSLKTLFGIGTWFKLIFNFVDGWFPSVSFSTLLSGFTLGKVFSYWVIFIDAILGAVFYAFLALYIMYRIVAFFYVFGKLLMFAGIVLRSFEPTKTAGAFLLSVGIGFYFVFPATYLLTSLMLGLHVFSEDEWLSHKVQGLIEMVFQDQSLLSLGGKLLVIPIFILTIASHVFTAFILPFFSKLLYKLVYSLCLGPFVTFMITLTLINIMTTAFGGRISELGRGVFKFI